MIQASTQTLDSRPVTPTSHVSVSPRHVVSFLSQTLSASPSFCVSISDLSDGHGPHQRARRSVTKPSIAARSAPKVMGRGTRGGVTRGRTPLPRDEGWVHVCEVYSEDAGKANTVRSANVCVCDVDVERRWADVSS
jgi:hypothetical protein